MAIGATTGYVPASGLINIDEEIEKLEKDLAYQQGFLNTVMKKLGNERFVNNAPEQVVAIEKKKKADAEAKIDAINSQLESLRS